MVTTEESRWTEREQVAQWRELELERAGYPLQSAIVLARLPDVDLHQACEMLAHGCSVDLAMKILT